MTANDYEVTIQYSSEHKGWMATVREFPHLYYVGRAKITAYEGLQMKLQSVLGTRRYNDMPLPRPLARAY